MNDSANTKRSNPPSHDDVELVIDRVRFRECMDRLIAARKRVEQMKHVERNHENWKAKIMAKVEFDLACEALEAMAK